MKCAAVAGLALLLVGFACSEVRANGGTLRLASAPAGPYVVSAWTQPDPPRIGRIDVSVAVMQPGTGEPVLDARARLVAEPKWHGGSVARTELQRGGGGNLLLYHGEVEASGEGRWRLTIEVEGPAGRGQAAFGLDVVPPNPVVWWLLGAASTVVVGLLGWRWARPARRPRNG